MAVAKIIEISSDSDKSFEDAIEKGIKKATKSVHTVKGAWIKEQQVVVNDDKIVAFRVDLKVTFILD